MQAELPTKAPLTDLPNLREKMEKKILLLKEDTHDQIHMLREDWSRRMRAVQTRLDTTDRELVRQVRPGLEGEAQISADSPRTLRGARETSCHKNAPRLGCGRLEIKTRPRHVECCPPL